MSLCKNWFYSECSGKPLNNFNEESDIIKQNTLKEKEFLGFCVKNALEKGKLDVERIGAYCLSFDER